MKDYIRLGLAIKARWPEIDFETVEIHEVPFGKACFRIPVAGHDGSELFGDAFNDCDHFWMGTVEMHRLRGKQFECMAGYAPASNRLLVGIKE